MTDIFTSKDPKLGTIVSVDTQNVLVEAESSEELRQVTVNQLVSIAAENIGQHYIGIVSKIIRKEETNSNEDVTLSSYNAVRVVLVGTYSVNEGGTGNVFSRSLSSSPSIGSFCYLLQGEKLKLFMSCVSSSSEDVEAPVEIGVYSADHASKAIINGDRFFQHHALIAGSTGSGKSWTVAKILEMVSNLPSSSAVLFDIHGEYSTLVGQGFVSYKIAGPSDSPNEKSDAIFLPYYLLSYEEMAALMLDRSDSNAPNQAMMFSKDVLSLKKAFLESVGQQNLANQITIDSPTPYSLATLLSDLEKSDQEIVTSSAGRDKQGPYYGKLTRFIQRLDAKAKDKRLNFLFNQDPTILSFDYFQSLALKILEPAAKGKRGVRIIDFSEVPSDILPLITSLLARLIFSLQQWSDPDKRNPVALFCEEAHLYIPSASDDASGGVGVGTFERIAKEGRKYGVSLVIISQRPSEVNQTVLSQLGNFVAMRLTNANDKSVVGNLIPDSLGDFVNSLPLLEVGEAVIVGDSTILPSRIRITPPTCKPRSATVNFWTEWSKPELQSSIKEAVSSLLKQSK